MITSLCSLCACIQINSQLLLWVCMCMSICAACDICAHTHIQLQVCACGRNYSFVCSCVCVPCTCPLVQTVQYGFQQVGPSASMCPCSYASAGLQSQQACRYACRPPYGMNPCLPEGIGGVRAHLKQSRHAYIHTYIHTYLPTCTHECRHACIRHT